MNSLAQQRTAKLKIIFEEERLEILKLEEQTQLLSPHDVTEDQLDTIMKEVEAEETEEYAKEQQAIAWLQSRKEKKQENTDSSQERGAQSKVCDEADAWAFAVTIGAVRQ